MFSTKIIFSILLFYTIFGSYNVIAIQNGLLPTGGLSVDGSSINLTNGEFYYNYEINENVIGKDNNKYRHNFDIELEINVSDYSSFSIKYYFATPFTTITGGSASLLVFSSDNEMDVKMPDFTNTSYYEFAFKPISEAMYIGNVNLELELSTIDEMSNISGNMEIEIISKEGIVNSVTLDQFETEKVDYITTLGPDNGLVPIDMASVIFGILLISITKIINRKKILKLWM